MSKEFAMGIHDKLRFEAQLRTLKKPEYKMKQDFFWTDELVAEFGEFYRKNK